MDESISSSELAFSVDCAARLLLEKIIQCGEGRAQLETTDGQLVEFDLSSLVSAVQAQSATEDLSQSLSVQVSVPQDDHLGDTLVSPTGSSLLRDQSEHANNLISSSCPDLNDIEPSVPILSQRPSELPLNYQSSPPVPISEICPASTNEVSSTHDSNFEDFDSYIDVVTTYKCRFCAFTCQWRQGLISHFKSCHHNVSDTVQHAHVRRDVVAVISNNSHVNKSDAGKTLFSSASFPTCSSSSSAISSSQSRSLLANSRSLLTPKKTFSSEEAPKTDYLSCSPRPPHIVQITPPKLLKILPPDMFVSPKGSDFKAGSRDDHLKSISPKRLFSPVTPVSGIQEEECDLMGDSTSSPIFVDSDTQSSNNVDNLQNEDSQKLHSDSRIPEMPRGRPHDPELVPDQIFVSDESQQQPEHETVSRSSANEEDPHAKIFQNCELNRAKSENEMNTSQMVSTNDESLIRNRELNRAKSENEINTSQMVSTNDASLSESQAGDNRVKTEQECHVFICGQCKMHFQSIRDCSVHMILKHKCLPRNEAIDQEDDTEGAAVSNPGIDGSSAQEAKEERKYKCNFVSCSLKFKTRTALEYHKSCHSQKGFVCCFCCEALQNWRAMSSHLWNKHNVNVDLYSCDICNYKSPHRHLLESHKAIHSDVREFVCAQCGKAFKTLVQLRNHHMTHIDRKEPRNRWYNPQMCPICDRMLSNTKCLKNHIASVHKKLKPFRCPHCDYESARKAMLHLHMRQHTGEKPFACELCDFRTSDHNTLRRHVMRHTGDKAYRCNYCDYSCVQHLSFKKHMGKHHPGLGGVFDCQMCKFRSVSLDKYLDHLKRHREGVNMVSRVSTKKSKGANNKRGSGNITKSSDSTAVAGSSSQLKVAPSASYQSELSERAHTQDSSLGIQAGSSAQNSIVGSTFDSSMSASQSTAITVELPQDLIEAFSNGQAASSSSKNQHFVLTIQEADGSKRHVYVTDVSADTLADVCEAIVPAPPILDDNDDAIDAASTSQSFCLQSSSSSGSSSVSYMAPPHTVAPSASTTGTNNSSAFSSSLLSLSGSSVLGESGSSGNSGITTPVCLLDDFLQDDDDVGLSSL